MNAKVFTMQPPCSRAPKTIARRRRRRNQKPSLRLHRCGSSSTRRYDLDFVLGRCTSRRTRSVHHHALGMAIRLRAVAVGENLCEFGAEEEYLAGVVNPNDEH